MSQKTGQFPIRASVQARHRFPGVRRVALPAVPCLLVPVLGRFENMLQVDNSLSNRVTSQGGRLSHVFLPAARFCSDLGALAACAPQFVGVCVRARWQTVVRLLPARTGTLEAFIEASHVPQIVHAWHHLIGTPSVEPAGVKRYLYSSSRFCRETRKPRPVRARRRSSQGSNSVYIPGGPRRQRINTLLESTLMLSGTRQIVRFWTSAHMLCWPNRQAHGQLISA